MSLRAIAMYLPQFHPIPENDEWWGKGFTEWTNVTRAKPLFKNHYQPQLPADLGFYDLRLAETRQAQADLAKQYGIYGFCYYHYWFTGKRLLQQPAEEMLQSGAPDFPFMFCWANENWTRGWDGGEDEILIKQQYGDADARAHCRALLPYFKDKRYIRIEGKPVFLIYKTLDIPDLELYIDSFREEALKENIHLYLGAVERFETLDLPVLNKHFDAAIEFQPSSGFLSQFIQKKVRENRLPYYAGRLYSELLNIFSTGRRYNGLLHRIQNFLDYNEYVDFVLQNHQYPTRYKRYPGVTPMWDNTARRGRNALLFKNANPEKYGEWLAFHKNNFRPYSAEENFLFINAWNEWAEGNHLEPCQKWGTTYLKITKEKLN